MLSTLYRAINVYTNYTGKANCTFTKNTAPSLGDEGWDYQACTEMVMPMCTDGRNDMFEPATWNFEDYNNTCFKKYSVSSQPYLACQQYGCKNLDTVTNINFRYINNIYKKLRKIFEFFRSYIFIFYVYMISFDPILISCVSLVICYHYFIFLI